MYSFFDNYEEEELAEEAAKAKADADADADAN